LRDKPLAVCGSIKDRHGIVLAKNILAKGFGIYTGQTYKEAMHACPNLIIVEPHFELYLKYSKMVRNIYLQYTDLVEPLGIDEAWLDVTNSKIFGSPVEIANEIRHRVFKESGLTISVGVSFNKIFAKLGSDLKKPDATTVIMPENFKEIVWCRDIEEMYGVGRAMSKKLRDIGINTIGDLARLDKQYLIDRFGKMGECLHDFSNGTGDYTVKKYTLNEQPKSIGNSTTSYKDLTTQDEIKQVLMMLTDSVVSRCLSHSIKNANTLSLYIKDSNFEHFSKQCTINFLINSKELYNIAYEFYLKNFKHIKNIRTLGLSVSGFEKKNEQFDMFSKESQKLNTLDETVKYLKFRFGENVIMRGNTLKDKRFVKKLHDN
jgi:DNA polymerase-4